MMRVTNPIATAGLFATERPTFNLMKSDFRFARRGQSGIEVAGGRVP